MHLLVYSLSLRPTFLLFPALVPPSLPPFLSISHVYNKSNKIELGERPFWDPLGPLRWNWIKIALINSPPEAWLLDHHDVLSLLELVLVQSQCPIILKRSATSFSTIQLSYHSVWGRLGKFFCFYSCQMCQSSEAKCLHPIRFYLHVRLIFLFIYLLMCMCLYAFMCAACLRESSEARRLLSSPRTRYMRSLVTMWGLGIKPVSSTRAGSALNHWAISLSHPH